MSYNHVMAVLPNTSVSSFGATGPAIDSFSDVTSSSNGGAFVTQLGTDVLLVDGTMQAFGDVVFENTEGAVVVMLSGVSDTYVIQRYGSRPRLRVESAGELVEDEGEPLAAESALDGEEFPEDAHFAFYAALTGVAVQELDGMRWTPIQL